MTQPTIKDDSNSFSIYDTLSQEEKNLITQIGATLAQEEFRVYIRPTLSPEQSPTGRSQSRILVTSGNEVQEEEFDALVNKLGFPASKYTPWYNPTDHSDRNVLIGLDYHLTIDTHTEVSLTYRHDSVFERATILDKEDITSLVQ